VTPDLPPDLAARRVISEQHAAELCGLSVATMRRMRQAGTGPAAVTLSSRRIGYRVATLDAWLAAREERAV
jgi:predicted DNA-binding transcriptional regulator AlpA